MDNRHLLNKTHVNVSAKCLKKWVSAFQQYRIISRKLARWRNAIKVFRMNSENDKEIDNLKCVRYLSLGNSNDPLIDRIFVMKKGSFLTNINNRLNHLTMKKHPNTFQSRNCMDRNYGECLVVCRWRCLLQLSEIKLSVITEVSCRKQEEIHVQLSKMQPALCSRWGPILFGRPIGLVVERSSIARKTGVQSQVKSYQRLKKDKTQKGVLDTSLLNTQYYKVRFKDKVQ